MDEELRGEGFNLFSTSCTFGSVSWAHLHRCARTQELKLKHTHNLADFITVNHPDGVPLSDILCTRVAFTLHVMGFNICLLVLIHLISFAFHLCIWLMNM